MKKKIVFLLITMCFLLFILMNVMIILDKRNTQDIYNDIIKNTDVKKIEYFNKYDDYYIVMDKKNLYLFNNDYVEITRIDLDLIHKNTDNYDIIYKDDKLFYMNDYKKKDKFIVEYYDMYEYKLVDKVIVGGK